MKKRNLCIILVLACLFVGCGNNNSVPMDEYTKVLEERESLKAELNNSVSKEEYVKVVTEKESLQAEFDDVVPRAEYDRIVREHDDMSRLLGELQTQNVNQQSFSLAGYWTFSSQKMIINNDKSFLWHEHYGRDDDEMHDFYTGIIDDHTLYVERKYHSDEAITLFPPSNIDSMEYTEYKKSYVMDMRTSNVFVLWNGNHMTNIAFTRQPDYDPRNGAIQVGTSKNDLKDTNDIGIPASDSTKIINLANMNDSNSYLCSWSESELITESQLQSLDYDTARIVLNEIYARRGRQFKDEGLSNYFASKSWYNGTIKPEDFSDEMLNEFEKNNIRIIQEYMDKKKQ